MAITAEHLSETKIDKATFFKAIGAMAVLLGIVYTHSINTRTTLMTYKDTIFISVSEIKVSLGRIEENVEDLSKDFERLEAVN